MDNEIMIVSQRKSGLKLRNTFWAKLFVISAFISIYAPYQGDSSLKVGALTSCLRMIQYGIFALLCLYDLFIAAKHRRNVNALLKQFIAAVPVIMYVAMTVFDAYGRRGDIELLTFFFAFEFCIASDEVKRLSFTYFRSSMVVFSAIGIVCYFSFVLSLPLPYRETNYYFSLEAQNVYMHYVDYGLCFLFRSGLIVRLCGICNEPGAWGTMCALILCADKLNIKRRSNQIILLAGFLTTSLAFVMIIFIYLLASSIKKPKAFIALLLLFLTVVFVLPKVHTGNASVDKLISRINFSAADMNSARSNDKVDALFLRAINEHFFFGFGRGYAAVAASGTLTYKTVLIEFGVVGFLLTYGMLAVCAMFSLPKKRNVIMYLVPFFASIYQRPYIFNLSYMLLLYGGALHYSMVSERQESKDLQHCEQLC